MKYEHGEWMGLYTDGDPVNFIKGHIAEHECFRVALEALKEVAGADIEIKIDSIIYRNARFGLGYDECGERCSWLYVNRPDGERGSFPITEVHYSIVNIW
ncbi:MAG: hypothetical protein IBX55_16965 [Methyloprofundus sp.]|nr:hypothetical protein [Methyloprofundus sp.]